MQDAIVPLTHLPADLEVLLEKTRAFIGASKAPATIRGYKSDWTDFASWAAARQLCALPAAPTTIALYISDRSSTLVAASLARRLTTISSKHKEAGYLESPTRNPLVAMTFRGIRREIGTAQKFKQALLSPEIRRIVACCPETLSGLRNKALLLISYAAMTRRSETAALSVEDAEAVPEGIVLTIRSSKRDQEAAGRKVGIPYGADETTCPVRALSVYMDKAGIRSGAIFREIDQKGRLSPFGLHPDSVGYIFKRCAARTGMKNVEEIAGHSTRSGAITEAARNNVPEYLIRRQSGHKPGSKTLDRYIRLGEMFTRNAAAGLGL